VPSGATALDVTLSGGNEEVCTIPSPTAGTWYIRVAAYTDISGVTLVGTSQ